MSTQFILNLFSLFFTTVFFAYGDKEQIVKNLPITVANTQYKVVHKLDHIPFLEIVHIEKKCKNEEFTNFFYRQFCKVKSLKHDKQKNQIVIEYQKIDRKSEDYQCKSDVITEVINLTDDCVTNKK
ncbi:hypothetical protein K2X05_04895 [bacterium]|nr:hypothetical protein [bacterium]